MHALHNHHLTQVTDPSMATAVDTVKPPGTQRHLLHLGHLPLLNHLSVHSTAHNSNLEQQDYSIEDVRDAKGWPNRSSTQLHTVPQSWSCRGFQQQNMNPNVLPTFPNYSINMCLIVVSTLLWSGVQGFERVEAVGITPSGSEDPVLEPLPNGNVNGTVKDH